MSGLDDFNARAPEDARRTLEACLDVPRWADAVVAGRPYSSLEALESTATHEAAEMSDAELERALARHPRIGERAEADRHDAAHSAKEQSGVDAGDAVLAAQLREGNLAYEARFGRVFLIRAAGRTGPEILTELRRRLANDDRGERAETIEQLTQIALLRLREVLA